MTGIKILVWDFDGTLYKASPQLWHDVRESEYRVIMDHTGWSREKTLEKFHALYKHEYQSATQVASKLANIPVVQAAREMETYYDRTKYLKKDKKLVALFDSLKGYTHYLLVNGIAENIVRSLGSLGLFGSQFVRIVTSELVGDNKPSPKGFQYILDQTGFAPQEHLMIGDRVDVDLEPAKALGMKTCLVTWGRELPKPDHVDAQIETVYTLRQLLI